MYFVRIDISKYKHDCCIISTDNQKVVSNPMGNDCLIRFDVTFATYYAKKRAGNKPHRVAITHVTKKRVRVIYALESQNINATHV